MTYGQQSGADTNSPHPRIFRLQETAEPVPKSSTSTFIPSLKLLTIMVRYLLLLAVILYASSNLVAGVPTNGHRHHDRVQDDDIRNTNTFISMLRPTSQLSPQSP
jgi:hypothetical protein